MDNTLFILLLIILVLITVIVNNTMSMNLLRQKTNEASEQNKIQPLIKQTEPVPEQSFYRRIFDPLTAPEKTYIPERPNKITNYQLMGFAYRQESDPNYNPDEVNRLMLYGRRSTTNRDRYDYYVITDKDSSVKIQVGDNIPELFTGDKIQISGFTGDFTVEIYENEEIYYDPNVY